MEQKQHRAGTMGRLPEHAPLANPYVPFQQENPPKYEARTGLVRGTLYPGLELPFMGMVNKHELPVTPKTELQALGFALNELALYLDTHPEDTEAFSLFRQYASMEKSAKAAYESRFGSLLQNNSANHNSYRWLEEPWPWNYERNEVK